VVDFIAPVLETDPDDISADAISYLEANIPGFDGSDGHLEIWQIYALARIVAEAMDTASAIPLTIFRYFGANLMGVIAIDAVSATIPTTWVVRDNAGYTIQAGTQVAWQAAGDELVAFTVDNDVVIPPGTNTTAAGAVTLTAVDAGTAANGLGPGAMVLLDPLAYVTSVTATAVSGGGVDAEDDDTYLARMIDELRLLTPRPILAPDFAVLARNVTGVHRATAVDNYNPADGTYTNERMVAVAAIDASGVNVGAPVKAAIQIYLDGLRELNFVVNVFDATHTVVNVTFQFKAAVGYDPSSVQAAAIQAVNDYLSPANWGVDPLDSAKVSWTNKQTVRYNDLIAALYGVAGLSSVTSLQINGVSGDLALPGAVSLPTIGAISGTLAP
jgi:hypothetical protein